MKFVTCIGATSGLNLITISPLFVIMCARYDLAGSNLATVGSLSFVRQAGSVLVAAFLAICASIDLTAASTAPAAGLAAGLAAALAGAGFMESLWAAAAAAGWSSAPASALQASRAEQVNVARARTRKRMRVPPRMCARLCGDRRAQGADTSMMTRPTRERVRLPETTT